MSSIDQRVVEMKFQNSQFQSGVSSTLSVLDKLKAALRLDGAKQGLEGVNAAAKTFSLAGMAQSIDGIASKFSTMSMIGITALTNVVNKAVDAGLRMAKSLTLEPVNAGFAEYELKMGSIQTMLANTERYGTTLKDVTRNLDELNTYADKTIYNFGDMTKNIGLFTNAGIKIDDATSMIKGFSNSAAASGTSAAGAAGAAYQLSQALSSGTVRLMDWKSLTNVGMGNKNMQNGLIEIADAMGTLEASSISATEVGENFNASLEKEWLTADVMSNYLKIMAGDMDAATMASMGLTEAQIKGLQQQAATAEDAATKVRTFTGLVGTLREGVGSSWAQTFDILIGDFNQATEMWTAVNDALGPMLAKSGEARNALLKGWADMGGRDMAIEAISNAFKALMGIIKPISAAFRQIFPATTVQELFKLTNQIRVFTQSLIIGGETTNRIRRTFAGLFAILGIGWEIIKAAASALFDLFGAASEGGGSILDVTAKIGDFLVKLHEAIKNGDSLGKFFGGLGKILMVPINLLKMLAGLVADAFGGLTKIDTGGLTSAFSKLEPMAKLGELASKAWEKVGEFVRGIVSNMGPLGDIFGDMFDQLAAGFTDGFGNLDFELILGAINTGLFAGLTLGIRNFFKNFGKEADEGEGIIDKIKGAIDGLTGTFDAMQNTLRAATLMTLAIAIGVMTASIVALSRIDAEDLAKSLTAMTIMFGQLFLAMMVFEKIAGTSKGFAKMIPMAAAMVILAVAVKILTSAVEDLAGLSWDELKRGLTGVGALLAMVVIASKGLSGSSGAMIRAGVSLVILAAAIKILVSAVSDLAGFSWEELAKGLGGVAVLLGALGLFTKFAEVNKGAVAQAAGLILLGVAIKILASAASDFAAMNVEELAKGIGSITILLAALAGFTKLTGEGKGLISTGAGMVLIAGALKILADVMGTFAAMDWSSLLKGLVGVAGALVAVAIGMNLMPKNMLISAAALVVVAGALTILNTVLQSMAGMTWEEIAKGLITLAGALLIIAVAMYAMSGALPGAAALLVVAASLAILGPILQMFSQMSWEEMGKGLLMLAGAFTILGLAGLLLTPVIPSLLGLGAAIGLIGAGMMLAGVGVLFFATGLTALALAGGAATLAIVGIVSGLIGLIPMVMQQIGLGLIAFAKVIATAGPAITEAITVVLMALMNAIIKLTPKIIQTLMTLLDNMLRALVAAVPKLVDAGFKILLGFLNGIAQNIGKVVTTAATIIVNFLNGISNNLPRIIQAGISLIISFVNGLANGIRNNTAAMQSAGRNLAGAIIDGMTGGLASGIGKIASKAREVARSALNAAKSFLGINSPSKAFLEIGKNVDEGFAIGMAKHANLATRASEGVGEGALMALRKSISGLSDIVSGEVDMTPVIAPVLDLSDVASKAKTLGRMIGDQHISVSTAYGQARSVATDQESLIAENMRLHAERFAEANNITFIQNNTSPKALTPAEIYRQTRNQLSIAKGALAPSA